MCISCAAGMPHFIRAGQITWKNVLKHITAAKYTRGRGPVTLVYSETLATREDALHRECEIKKMTKTAKLALIEQNINEYKQKY